MIISRARRFIFVHVPKTGGTALSLALEARAAKDDVLIGDTPKARARAGRWKGVKAAGRVWKHSTLADVVGLVSLEEIERLQVVTLVRNPWDRAVSYYHWLRGQSFAHPAVGLAKTHDFSGFLNHPQTVAAFRLWPYGAYVRRPDGEENPCLFIRLESFAKEAVPFEAHLGFRLALPRVNESDRARDWRPYYSPADAALVAEVCGEDIARFGYRFDP
ncbi:sulfotransferase domain-containing protein [Rhodobacter sp. Har01]|uniref:sulfotransferase domain-containing protein n=1 Tax=Rhodobacter sp. Har01 TaxID=2883999 RepID=UPI001D06B5FD|nr:sulfotransferase domain-containing protein [Rhodobacter sp. Har01]MCB6179255.1 sulfotransferase domain-containing protein [Rhodobacter sp. Har01]